MRRKILIISHNPINETDNMGKTIGNLFSEFSKSELCQLYFREQNTEAKNCDSFFCISDDRMIRSILNAKYNTGRKINNHYQIKKEECKSDNKKQNIFQYGRRRTGNIYLLRNLLWKIGKWDTKELKEWLEKEKPTSIFFVAGDYTFAFDIAIKISKDYNIPIYIFFSDEFYRKEISKKTLGARIYKSIYRKKFKRTIMYAKEYFCISEAMEEFYEEEFTKRGIVLMNTTNIESENEIRKTSKKIIRYIGNLGYDRWKNIISIGNVVKKINDKYEKEKLIFEVYSGEKNRKITDKLKSTEGIAYKGYIEATEVKKKILESDILIHTEDFNKENIQKVKYSVSTKIPDYLASGRLLIAYGPEEIESNEYIKRNEAGIVVNSEKELEIVLENILSGEIDTKSIINNAINLVEKNHRSKVVYDKLNKYLI